jgi:hypothetical protein
LLKRQAQRRLVVVVAHRPALVGAAQRVLRLEHGRVSETVPRELRFARELYDHQYGSYRDDLPFTPAGRRLRGPVLELGGGHGARLGGARTGGHEVVALEPSREMTARAGSPDREGLSRVSYHQGDMRTARLGRRFPLIIAPFKHPHARLYPVRPRPTLQTVRVHLEVGGRFAFDLYTPNFSELNTLRLEPNGVMSGAR